MSDLEGFGSKESVREFRASQERNNSSKSQQKRICVQSECAVRDELRSQIGQKDKELEINYALMNRLTNQDDELKARNKLLEGVAEAVELAINDDDSWGCDVTTKLHLQEVLSKLNESEVNDGL